MVRPQLWTYESIADREKRQQSGDNGYQDWSSKVQSTLGLDGGFTTGTAASSAPPITREQFQAIDRQPSIATTPPPAPVSSGRGGGGFLSRLGSGLTDVADTLGNTAESGLHLGLTGLNKVLSPIATAGQMAYAPLTGETSAGRHPILDANGNPTGQFYRDAPDWRDVGSSLGSLVRHPLRELQAGPQAFQERLQNPNMTALSRGILEAGSNPLTYAFGPEAAGVNIGATVGMEALNENADKIPGYRNLTPDEQQALMLVGPAAFAKFAGRPITEKAVQSYVKLVGPDGKFVTALQKTPLRGFGGSIVEESNPYYDVYLQTLAEHNIPARVDSSGRLHVADRAKALQVADDIENTARIQLEGTAVEGGSGITQPFHFGTPEYEAWAAERRARRVRPADRPTSVLPNVDAVTMQALDDAERIREVTVFGRINPAAEELRQHFPENSILANFKELTPAERADYAGPLQNLPAFAADARRALGRDEAVQFVNDMLNVDMSPRGVSSAIEAHLKQRGFTVGRTKLTLREQAYRDTLAEISDDLTNNGLDSALPAMVGPDSPGGIAVPGTEANVGPTISPATGEIADTVVVYHGTGTPLPNGQLARDSFVTTDANEAALYARTDASLRGGQPIVYAYEIPRSALKPNPEQDFAATAGHAMLVDDPTQMRLVSGGPPEAAAGAPPGGVTGGGAPPTQPPGAPPVPSPAGAPGPKPGLSLRGDPFKLPKIVAGLTKVDEWMNALKRTLNVGTLADPLATPAMRMRRMYEAIVGSHADSIPAVVRVIRDRAFKTDEVGRILDLEGKPTLQDVAARLPKYLPLLTEDQIQAMQTIRDYMQPYTDSRAFHGIEHGYRADIEKNGGFYLPRGRADIEGVDAPMKVGSGRGHAGGKSGSERHATFVPGENDLGIESMAQAIDAGYEYAPFEEVMRQYVRDTGKRVVNKQVADYFLGLSDEDGRLLAETSVSQMNPIIQAEFQGLKQLSVRLSRKIATAEKRANITGAKADELAAVLERQATGATLGTTRGAESGVEIGARMQAMRNRITPPPRTAEVATNEITTLNNFINRAQKRIIELRQKGNLDDATLAQLQDMQEQVNARLDIARPKYQRAIDNSKQLPRDRNRIELEGLQNYTFPDHLANAAQAWINNEKPAIGQQTQVLRGVNAFNNLLRGLRASTDVSFMGIQGLLGAVHDPIGYGKALGLAWKSMGDPQALGKYLLDFDKRAAETGRPTFRQWIEAGAHIGGADTEFAIGKGLPTWLDAIGKGGKINPVRGSNRAFGYFGDTLRLEMADTAYANALKHGFPPGPETMNKVAEAANLATGWSQNAFGGSSGNLFFFAPRFFQSQLELVTKAASDRTLTGHEARMMLGKLLGSSVILTAAANEFSPNGLKPEEYLNPFKDGNPLHGMNPNFMRIRFGGNDISLIGPWDSLLRATMNLAQGDPSYLARTKASPAISLGWDLFTGKTFTGADSRTPTEIMRNLLPFSLQQAPEAIGAAATGDFSQLGTEAIGTTGLKSTPMTPNEQINQLTQALHGKDFNELLTSEQEQFKKDHPDLWQRAVERKSSESRRFELLKTELTTQQQASDDQLRAGTLDRQTWRDQFNNRRQQLFGIEKALFDSKPISEKDATTAEKRYIRIIQQNSDAAGAVDWDKVDAAVANLSAEDQAYIEDRQGVGNTKIVAAYKAAAKQRSEQMNLPTYRGFTADEARSIDEIWTQARALSKTADAGPMLAAVRKIAAEKEIDPHVLSGVRRRIVGTMTTLTTRKKYAKAHPEMTLFFGGNGKAGPLTPEERALLPS